jgi:ATP-dependent RNA helicase RhlE
VCQLSDNGDVSANQDVSTFRDFPLHDSLQASIAQAGFERPTPIQAELIPPALAGKDVIGLAQTGTGKTAAFAIPIIQRLVGRVELGALVLAPTRELAAQITTVFEQLGAGSGVRVATIVGGVPMEKDYAALRSWPNVLVATPGRLIDHLDSEKLPLGEVEVLVVDEADRMHDMGFVPQIRRIVRDLPAGRQTMMVTATMPRDVEHIARQSMSNPLRIKIGITAPAQGAAQVLYEVGDKERSPLLQKLIRDSSGRVLVFARTRRTVDRMDLVLRARGFEAAKIHGQLDQSTRDRAMGNFRDGSCRVLIATDIAARGLDISDIEHVINYDFPQCPEDYVHRVGRTARVDATGTATSLITPEDYQYVRALRRLLGDKLPQPERLDSYDSSQQATGDGGRGRRGRGGPRKGRGGRGRSSRGRSRRTAGQSA